MKWPKDVNVGAITQKRNESINITSTYTFDEYIEFQNVTGKAYGAYKYLIVDVK